ncbi:hypothetical protein E2C01_051247 [Portunus trituberculatus]|uniref:Uncharacterized protein n=1 Tax=Portunus trituberculatus TaxID=210409 RepID=A0A5B7GID9_PORTR|nr:hypothetical protein [Portunus trituberculatus]
MHVSQPLRPAPVGPRVPPSHARLPAIVNAMARRRPSQPDICNSSYKLEPTMSAGSSGNGTPPAKKPLPRVRKPNLHSDRGQHSNPCAWRPLGPQSTHGSSVSRRPHEIEHKKLRESARNQEAFTWQSLYDTYLPHPLIIIIKFVTSFEAWH